MNQKSNAKKQGPEFATAGGKEDASIHDPILDNPEANKFFQEAAIRQAVAGGMSLEMAKSLFGNYLK